MSRPKNPAHWRRPASRVVSGLPSKSQDANAAVSGPPSECPPQMNLWARRFWPRMRCITRYQSRIVRARPKFFMNCASSGSVKPPKRLPPTARLPK